MSGAPRDPLAPEACARLLGVSRETLRKLEAYLALLRTWQATINLVGAATLADPWRRHILDCGQLARHWPAHAGRSVDVGSGAGLPGLVLAAMGVPGLLLVESDRRKAAFLREAARRLALAVEVRAERVENLQGLSAEVVCARALAPVGQLLALTSPLRTDATLYLLLKGRHAEDELTAARARWNMRGEMAQSISDADGRVLKLSEVSPCVNP